MRHYYFFIVFFLLMSATSWVSIDLEKSGGFFVQIQDRYLDQNNSQSIHQVLMEDLDRMVNYQHYYRSVHGSFTYFLNRTGVSVSQSTHSFYEVRVLEASANQFLIQALSEKNGKLNEVVTIDQNFDVHSNFPIPSPRRNYLKAQAMKQLRWMQKTGQQHPGDERTIYRGYFNYRIRRTSEDEISYFAQGLREPVKNLEIEINLENDRTMRKEYEALVFSNYLVDPSDLSIVPSGVADSFELNLTEEVASQLKTIEGDSLHLGKKIFEGEMGRASRDSDELNKIVDLDRSDLQGRQDQSSERELNRTLSSEVGSSTSSEARIEYEPVSDGN